MGLAFAQYVREDNTAAIIDMLDPEYTMIGRNGKWQGAEGKSAWNIALVLRDIHNPKDNVTNLHTKREALKAVDSDFHL